MSLEASIKELVEAAVRESLDRHLPALLAEASRPVEPTKCRSIADTAEYLGVTPSCIKERINEGQLETIRLGKYVLVPHSSVQALVVRELERQRYLRRRVGIEGSDMDAEINEALGLAPPAAKGAR